MRTFKDIRDKIATYMQPDIEGNIRLYNYLRYRQDEIDADLRKLDNKLADIACTLGIESKGWLHQARNRLASTILERDISDWSEVQSTEHTQIILWALLTTNFSGLRSWLRSDAKLARR